MTKIAALNTNLHAVNSFEPDSTHAGQPLTAKIQLWLTKRFQVLASTLTELKVAGAYVYGTSSANKSPQTETNQPILLWQNQESLEQKIHNAEKLVQLCIQRQKIQLYSDKKSLLNYVCFSSEIYFNNDVTCQQRLILYFVFTRNGVFTKEHINSVMKNVAALFFYKTDNSQSSPHKQLPLNPVHPKPSAEIDPTRLIQGLVKIIERHININDATYLLAKDLKEKFECECVVISLPNYSLFSSRKKNSNRIVAISDSSKFDDQSPLIKQYSKHITKTLQREPENNHELGRAYCEHIIIDHPLKPLQGAVISIDTELGCACILFVDQHNSANAKTNTYLTAAWQTLGTSLLIRHYLQLSPVKKLGYAVANSSHRIQLPKQASLKAGFFTQLSKWQKRALVVAVVIAILGILNIPTSLTITTKAEIISDSQRALVAPVDGFIKDSHFKAGDQVKTGHLLATLDDKDLNLEKQKLENELQEYDKLYRKELAEFNQVQAKIVKNQREQTQAKIELINERLTRLKIKAPFDGIILHGDVSQLLGAPVKKGEILFELAPLTEYNLNLRISEKDIIYIRKNQHGLLKLFSLPSAEISFTISEVTPIAETVDDKVYFIARSHWNFDEKQQAIIPTLLKPGMTGSAKINTDKQPLWKILFRDLIRWWQLNRWQLGL